MKENELLCLLALQRVEGVGDIIAKKLLNQCGTAEEIFKSKNTQLASIDGIGKILLKNIKEKAVFIQAEKELQYIQKNNIKVSFFKEDSYPDRLKHCIDSPILLFSVGNINIKQKRIISIVGTRQVTAYGTAFCKNLIADLAPLEPIIVSGFAYGVDIIAHQAAMENNLQTIGVLAHGLSQIYPKSHKKYMHKMEENGGFITDFWSNTNPDREHFIKRNRIVAGISEATIVIESADKGGSLITATMASDYNRDVFAVPGRVTDKFSQGCNNLIKTQRAHVMTSAADIIYMLDWKLKGNAETTESKKTIQKQLFITLNPDEQLIFDYLEKKGKEQMDVIALQCDLPIFKLSSLLLNMELKGVVRPLPGKLFEVV
jgi:DNA processing protein